MSYRDHLWRMLEPLGVYRGDGFSGGELAALGTGMDRLRKTLEEQQKEMLVMTAEGVGLELTEALFPVVSGEETAVRRAILSRMYRTDHGAFTKEALMETLTACGIPVTMGVTGTFTALVVLDTEMTIQRDPVWVFQTMERVLPCHLLVTVKYEYVEIDTGERKSERLPLKTLRKRTQSQWEQMLGALM